MADCWDQDWEGNLPSRENEGESCAVCPWDQDSEEALTASQRGHGYDKKGTLPFDPLTSPIAPQHLLKCSFDVVKRWVNEAQEAASSDNIMVQVRMVLDKQVHHTVVVPAPQVMVASGRDRLSSFCH